MAFEEGGECAKKGLLSVPALPIQPHLLFFLIYNAIYLTPLLLVYFLGFSEGGSEDLIGLKGIIIARVAAVYGMGILAFFAGTRTYAFLRWSILGTSNGAWQPRQPEIGISEKSVIFFVTLLFVGSKIALIPLGVYNTYTIEMMTGGAWSFSAFCSETLVLIQVLVLFSRLSHRLSIFLGLCVVNGINLLHGSRVFFIINAMTALFFFYIQGKVKMKRVILFGPPAFFLVLCATYAVYLSRMSAFGMELSAGQLVSPLVYESVFSQFSIIGTVSHTDLWLATGRVGEFLKDVALFSTPRILIPDKESMLFIPRFDYLSPKGAFNGYAAALLYFGFLFPIFYYTLGLFGDWLYRSSRRSSWHFILYVYFSVDFCLHIMRDGLLIPIKMLTNAVQILVLLYLANWFSSFLSSKPIFVEPQQFDV
jgi:hypothetical protein